MEIKLGKPVTVYGSYTGALIKLLQNSALVSFFAEGTNMYQEVPLDEIEVGGELLQPKRTNEYIEKEDAGCEGGACKI